MVITFPYAFGGKETPEHVELGNLFVSVTRKYVPKAQIVQMSDEETAEIKGVDSVFRLKTPPLTGNPTRHRAAPGIAFAEWYFDAMMAFPAERFLRADYDVMIREDVSDVFHSAVFDIAIAKEHNGRMNNGIVFVRNKDVFLAAKEAYAQTTRDNWQDVQTAMQRVIDSGEFRVKKLPETYNTIYGGERAIPSEVKILHFKGARKGAMLDLFK